MYTDEMQDFITCYHQKLIVISGLVLVIVAFYTGFLEGKHISTTQPVTLACNDNILDKLSIPVQALANGVVVHASSGNSVSQGVYVGSINSTKYYLPICKAVKRIKPANYIWFSSQQDAQIQGYTQGKC